MWTNFNRTVSAATPFQISCMPFEIKGAETFLMLILSCKKLTLQVRYTSFMLLTKKFANYQKIGKSHKGRNYFCSQDRQHSRHIFKLGVWHVAKTRACLLRFSALKL